MPRTFVRPLLQPQHPRVAVIGAGISGLACAQRLLAAGLHPRVFERARAPGGRAGTRATEAGSFDHGAQEFHDEHGVFAEQLAYWIENGMAMDWRARVVRLGADGAVTPTPGARFVGVPSMQALSDDLARGVDLVVDAQVRRVVRDAPGQWFVEMRTERGDVLDGPFESAIVAVAAAQAVPLLAELPEFQARAAAVSMLPVWTLLIAYNSRLDVPYEVALPDDDMVAWMGRDSAKPGRGDGERWVVHAAPDWSLAHLDDDPEAVRTALAARFAILARATAVPSFVAVQRWRYAIATHPLATPHLWDADARMGACGDWFGGPDGPGSLALAYASGDALGLLVAHAMHESAR